MHNTRGKKGVILAGGTGSRLRTATTAINKHLLSVFDKPMIYYPLTTLILAGATDVAITCNEEDEFNFKKLLGNGEQLGIRIKYFIQNDARGIVDALKACQQHWENSEFVLALGDNLFFGANLSTLLLGMWDEQKSVVFGYEVAQPDKFGVIEFDLNGQVVSLEEKPKKAKSNIIATGLYKFGPSLNEKIEKVKLSNRGELEIMDLLNFYLQESQLSVILLKRGYAWLDMGTVNDMYRAAVFIKGIQDLQGLLVGSPEEASWRTGNLSDEKLKTLCENNKSAYYQYLKGLPN